MNKKIIHEVFEHQAVVNSSRIAVEDAAGSISYMELNRKANRMAYLLRRHSTVMQPVVAVLVQPGIDMVCSLLAIFKIGGIYLPVDLSFSENRFEQIFTETSPAIFITAPSMEADARRIAAGRSRIILVDNKELMEMPEENPGIQVLPDDGNYIFYTSGSTGGGKAILGCHKGLSHFIHWEIGEFGITPECRVSQLTQYTFDASLRDIFVPLLAGGTLCIPEPGIKTNIPRLLEWLREHRITLMHTVPSFFRLLMKDITHTEVLKDLQYLLLSGEALYARDVINWRRVAGDHTELVNLYGPTETTLVKTFHRIGAVAEEQANGLIHAGKPISNTAIAIINHQANCAIGEIGEIYIKTPFRTKGYYNNPELTSKVFVQNPLVSGREDIVYKTGDIGRYLEDESIEILGRIDEQVKINGIRVEPGEIESAGFKLIGVEEIVVVPHQGIDNSKELVCYYVGPAIEKDVLKNHLRKELNENIVPAYFVKMDVFPLSLNGKVDKKYLPKPEELLMEDFPYEPVANDIERRLEAIWKKVLGRKYIGRKAPFFSIGGTSLKAILVLSRIYREFDISRLIIADMFKYQTIGEFSRLIEQAKKEKYRKIEKVAQQEFYPLSHAQRRLWIIDQLETETGNAGAYNISAAFWITGALEASLLNDAMLKVVERHEILRTLFIQKEGIPYQRVLNAEEAWPGLEIIDVRYNPDPESSAVEISKVQASARMNLEKGPLLNLVLIQVADNRWLFSVSVHHIISDATSIVILLEEITALYNNPGYTLKPLNIQYKDYAEWQNRMFESGIAEEHLLYWKQQLGGVLPALSLPADFPRPETKKNNGALLEIMLDRQMKEALLQKSRESGATLFMVLLATVKALLYRYSGESDIIIGTPVSGREHLDLEDQIGFYVNTLAMRTQVPGQQGFDQLLNVVRQTVLDAFEHQQYPFEQLVGELEIERTMARMPVFDVMMSLIENAGGHEISELSGTNSARMLPDTLVSKFDMTFVFSEQENGIVLQLEYCTDLFHPASIERMMEHYRNLLVKLLEDSTASIEEIDCLTTEERQLLISGTNNDHTHISNDTEKDVVMLFLRQVALAPDNIAVMSSSGSLSYSQLDEYSDRVADYLRKNHKVRAGDRVGLIVNRSEWMIAAIIGILKSGACYVPVDPDYPAGRKEFMMKDAGVKVIVAEKGLIAGWDAGVQVSDLMTAVNTERREALHYQQGELLYVMYTSGSTGIPKGCMVGHTQVVNLVMNTNYTSIHNSDRILQLSNYAFDGSVFDIFGSLLNGACLCIPDREVIMYAASLAAYIEKERVNIMFITTALFNNIVDLQPELIRHFDKIYFGGERVSVPHVRTALQHRKYKESIVHVYGPTEATTFSSFYIIADLSDTAVSIPIGQPVSNAKIYILNEAQQLQPIGVLGDIYIGGAGVSYGYLNQPDLTAEKFIDSPFVPGDRLYMTGDTGCWLEDMNIDLHGRKDRQIKIRGNRVEPGEVEAVLLSFEGVTSAFVCLRNGQFLTGYYIGNGSISEEKLWLYLHRHLPAVMIPSYLVCVDSFSLNANGKIDIARLQDPLTMRPDDTVVYQEPSDELEEKMVAVWKEILQHQQVGTQDNFFRMGGHSISATKLVSSLSRQLNRKIMLRDIFLHPTISGLAAALRLKDEVIYQPIPLAEKQSCYPLSAAQQQLWLADQLESHKSIFNISGAYLLHGNLHMDAINYAFNQVLDRHESLRTVFRTMEGVPCQYILPAAETGFSVQYTDLSGEQDPVMAAENLTGEDAGFSFDLATGPLVRAALLKLEEKKHVFSLVVHHIIADGWSIEVLLKEVLFFYQHFGKNATGTLSSLRIQYKDYAVWQHNMLKGNGDDTHRRYWLTQLEGNLVVTSLTPDYQNRSGTNSLGDTLQQQLDNELAARIIDFSTANNITVLTTLFAMVNLLVHRYTGQTDLVIGLPTSGRTHHDLQDQVGLYINILPIRVPISPESTFRELLDNVHRIILDAYRYESYPYIVLREELRQAHKDTPAELFNILFQLDYAPQYGKEANGLTADTWKIRRNTSKYDVTFFFGVDTRERSITLTLEYKTALFKQTSMCGLINDFMHMAGLLMANGELLIRDPHLIDSQEELEEMNLFNKPVNDMF